MSKPATETIIPPAPKPFVKPVAPAITKENEHKMSQASSLSGDEKEKKFFSREELEEFREIILSKLAEAREEYDRLAESLKETNDMAADGYNLTDFGSDTLDKEQTEMFMARQKKFMHNLEKAMMRIENGTYGRCKVTGKLIPKERLRIVPHTESSIEAKRMQADMPVSESEEG